MDSTEFPKISIVTPSYNQGQFLEAALRSVLDQGYPNLEYVVMDGGSTDDSVSIIKRYEDRLHYWQSEPDGGQYAALNKGFAQTSGEIMGWINSDDMHLPWTLKVVGEIFSRFPQVDWLSTRFPVTWREDGIPVGCDFDRDGVDRKSFIKGSHCPGLGFYVMRCIQQESTFWRRSLWEKCGGRLDDTMSYAADFDLWARFVQKADPYFVSTPLAGFRKHKAQKTANFMHKYEREAWSSLIRNGGARMPVVQQWLRLIGMALPRRVSSRLHLLQRINVIESNINGEWECRRH